MKKKLSYLLFAAGLVFVTGFIMANNAHHKTKMQACGTLTIVNNTSANILSVTVDGTTYTSPPYDYSCSSDFPVTVTFSSSVTGALEITDPNGNTLGCSPMSTGFTTSRTLAHCQGYNGSVTLEIYTTQGCP